MEVAGSAVASNAPSTVRGKLGGLEQAQRPDRCGWYFTKRRIVLNDRAQLFSPRPKLLQPNLFDGVPDKWCVFAAINLDGVEAGVPGLASDGGTVGTVSGCLGDESCAQ